MLLLHRPLVEPRIAIAARPAGIRPKSTSTTSTASAGAPASVAAFDLEQPPTSRSPSDPSSSSSLSSSPSGGTRILSQMPNLKDPELLASMTTAIADVSQTRAILRRLGPRPDLETVDNAKAKLAKIEASLSKRLEEIVLTPRPEEVDRLDWREQLAQKEDDCRQIAEKEKTLYLTILQLEEMHVGYDKLLKEAGQRLVQIYENSEQLEGEEEPVAEEVNEEVVKILQEASVKGLIMKGLIYTWCFVLLWG